jgi:protein-disulfide isomerase
VSKRAATKRSARVVREQLARERRRRRTLVASIAAGAALLVAGVTGFAVYAAQRPEGGFPVPASATVDRAGLALGTGPVTVEIYLDYLCPACRGFEQDAGATIGRLVTDGRITLVYHPAAILDGYSTNKYSSRSAAGAGCAADAGKLAEYTKALYADQPAEGGPGHSDDRLVEMATTAGAPAVAFGQCLREGRYADWVTHVTDAMSARGVNGTPTVFVNGRKLANPTAQSLQAAVAQAGA